MARGLSRFLVSLLFVAICNAASVSQPISESHRSAALDVFVPLDGSYKRLVFYHICADLLVKAHDFVLFSIMGFVRTRLNLWVLL